MRELTPRILEEDPLEPNELSQNYELMSGAGVVMGCSKEEFITRALSQQTRILHDWRRGVTSASEPKRRPEEELQPVFWNADERESYLAHIEAKYNNGHRLLPEEQQFLADHEDLFDPYER